MQTLDHTQYQQTDVVFNKTHYHLRIVNTLVSIHFFSFASSYKYNIKLAEFNLMFMFTSETNQTFKLNYLHLNKQAKENKGKEKEIEHKQIGKRNNGLALRHENVYVTYDCHCRYAAFPALHSNAFGRGENERERACERKQSGKHRRHTN